MLYQKPSWAAGTTDERWPCTRSRRVHPPPLQTRLRGPFKKQSSAYGLCLKARVSGHGLAAYAAVVDVMAILRPLLQKVRAQSDIDAGRPSTFHDAPFLNVHECDFDPWISVCPIEARVDRELLERLGLHDVDPAPRFHRSTWPATQKQSAQFIKTLSKDFCQ